jgi:hypothetical protein
MLLWACSTEYVVSAVPYNHDGVDKWNIVSDGRIKLAYMHPQNRAFDVPQPVKQPTLWSSLRVVFAM